MNTQVFTQVTWLFAGEPVEVDELTIPLPPCLAPPLRPRPARCSLGRRVVLTTAYFTAWAAVGAILVLVGSI